MQKAVTVFLLETRASLTHATAEYRSAKVKRVRHR
ncbi:hypothetical protein SULPSESMR1_04302 (plasmid) [Pseudosulfitobacter pseudonitzschiae]|uniref:Uncharacterized protein n=1 Tax=Pseudosulfitobacter pseudonitzschiae TaxID=1402135 RepID=A0A221K7P1_9RHOB|nr:hypothetical protein SULPSESMR1_04302 [Pseudosulfitobacter pseudonitzschiae]